MIEELKNILRSAEALRALQDRLTASDRAGPLQVTGAAGSLLPLLAAVLRESPDVAGVQGGFRPPNLGLLDSSEIQRISPH